ncbi:MAG TPA: isochorismatase family protein [Opitutus sp.]|nr:isochorismatase family protein [Opitutus sp.]
MADSTTTTSHAGLLLLCIDLQPVFLQVMAESESIQRRCAFAIQAATGLGLSIVFTEQVPHKLGGTSPALIDLVTSPIVFAKNTFSALADPVIREAILFRNPEHVLVCGIETSVCVHQTALDALAAGLQVTLLSDCVGARRPDDARTCIDALIRAGVHVLPSETVFYSLLRDVNHPFFRGYTQLVKAHA